MLRALIIILYLSTCPAFSQGNFIKILERDYSLDLDVASYPELKFEWNFPGKVQAYVNAGMTEMSENENFEKAIANFDEAIKLLPSFGPAYYYRGICYKILKKYSEAKHDLSKATSLNPTQSCILTELAEIYELQFQYPEAVKFYNQSIAIDPSSVPAYYNLANLHVREKSFGKAERLLKKCTEIDPMFVAAHLRLGIVSLITNKNTGKVINHLNDALAKDSSFQAALFWRSLMYLREADMTKSLKDWNKLVLYNPGNPLFTIQRALLYLRLQDYDKAFLDLKNVVSKRYDDENQFRGEQSLLDKQLDLQFAVSYITRNIYGLSDDAMTRLKKGFCLMVMDNEQEAIKEIKESFNLQPSAVSLFLTALTFEHSKMHDSAFVYYDKALSLDQDIFDAHKKRAIYRSELKDWKGANEDFNEMIRLEPGLIVTYRLRSLIRVQFKDFYGAIIDLTKYLKSDTTNYEIWMTRAYCKNAVADFKGANYDYRKSLELNKKNLGLYEQVVDTDLILKDTTHALQTIKDCEEHMGLSPAMFSLQVRIFILQNKLKEAKASMQILTEEQFSLDRLSDVQTSTILFLEGWMEYVEKDFTRALKKLNKSVQVHKENYEAMYLRSKIYLESGNKTGALKDLQLLARVDYSNSRVLLAELRR